MAEKRGLESLNLKMEFPQEGSLEVFNHKFNDWFRVTSREFRSFNGPRRITLPDYVLHAKVDVPMTTFEYYGPVYRYGTNDIVEYSDTGSLEKSKIWEQARKISEQRGK